MTARIDVHAIADNDIISIACFIGRDDPQVAERFIDAADATFHLLAYAPGIGRAMRTRKRRHHGVRVFRVQHFPNYMVYYKPIRDGVHIFRVLHAAQDRQTILDLND